VENKEKKNKLKYKKQKMSNSSENFEDLDFLSPEIIEILQSSGNFDNIINEAYMGNGILSDIDLDFAEILDFCDLYDPNDINSENLLPQQIDQSSTLNEDPCTSTSGAYNNGKLKREKKKKKDKNCFRTFIKCFSFSFHTVSTTSLQNANGHHSTSSFSSSSPVAVQFTASSGKKNKFNF
jgi:hypothetical protein